MKTSKARCLLATHDCADPEELLDVRSLLGLVQNVLKDATFVVDNIVKQDSQVSMETTTSSVVPSPILIHRRLRSILFNKFPASVIPEANTDLWCASMAPWLQDLEQAAAFVQLNDLVKFLFEVISFMVHSQKIFGHINGVALMSHWVIICVTACSTQVSCLTGPE
ncbi:hypothetical protein O6P43_003297 [Quillaja saponaria]|uniref:Uncharacterized protein n=1 Tax=Quillaja saponaria TaxID=32244 RepID=A0AAD7VLA7_QUISA|nr:hypothetical protein O6P43_003297 [Quillaja saponaria]